MIKYSFIVPVKNINDYIREAIPKILAIASDSYEIIIYPDEVDDNFVWPGTRQIATGHVGPAVKRSMAINDAVGDILIFVDDDAYPAENFLEILDQDFKASEIMAVGGPAITPESDNFWQKVSGAVFLSPLSGGAPERYIPLGSKKLVEDWPSVNFSIRKKVFAELNGFDSEFWPGEDTKLCLDLIRKYPGSILYDPTLTVFHHRRAGLLKHLKQVSGYGLHRGFFAKKYPATSFKFKYFVPSIFLIFAILGGIISPFNKIIFGLYLIGWIIYLMALAKAMVDIRRYEKNFLAVSNAVYYIFFTHLVYGFNFIKGFVFTKNLISKLR